MSGLFASYRMTRINENSGRVRLLFFCLILLTLAGCQSFPGLEDPRLRDEQTFQHMWRLYCHCRSSEDPEEMREDLGHLGRLASGFRNWIEISFLQEAFATLGEEAPSPISVDPEAMMAVCALQAGQVASMTERTDIADELYRLVLSGSWKSLPRYYVEQARSGLARLKRTTDLASENTDVTTAGPLN